MDVISEKKKQIKDKLYGYLEFSPLEIKIIDHPLFQRLKHIRQLGFAFNAYPSADHKRFEHSIGVVYVATEIIETILSQGDESLQNWLTALHKVLTNYNAEVGFSQLPEILVKIVRIAALLHDVGHLPFSHTFEIALEPILYSEQITELKLYLEKRGISLEIFENPASNIQIHETLGHNIIMTQLKPILDQLGSWVAPLICDIFEIDPDKLGKNDGVLLPLQRIVNGPLDADRLDYVLRDHYSSGIRLGTFDRERLVRNLLLIQKSQAHFDLGLKMKAISAVNSFILLRSMMYRYLYQHHLVSMYDNVFAIMIELFFMDSWLKGDIADLAAFFLRLEYGELESYLGSAPKYMNLLRNAELTPQWLINNPVIPFDDISLMSTLRMYVADIYNDLPSWKKRMSEHFGKEFPNGFKNFYAIVQNPLILFEAFNNRGKIPVALWNNYKDYTEIVISPIIQELKNYLSSSSKNTIFQIVDSIVTSEIETKTTKSLKEKLTKYFEDTHFLKKIKKHIAEEIIIHYGFKYDKSSFYSPTALPGKFDILQDLVKAIKNENIPVPDNIVISAKFPRTYDENIFFVDIFSKKDEVQLEDISPFISPLKYRVQDQPFFYVYIQSEELTRDQLKQKMPQYRDAMRLAIKNWLKRETRPGSKITNLEYLFIPKNP